MITQLDSSEQITRSGGADRAATARLAPDADRFGNDETVWGLHHELRSSLNALGLCVRVLESGPPDREAREYAKFISEASEKIERLVAKLRPSRLP